MVELYELLQLRSEVFVVEQNCVYQDLDGKDSKSFHVLLYSEAGELIGTARVLPPGVSYAELSLGRVCVHFRERLTGSGKVLMKRVVEFIDEKWPKASCVISAQLYLKKFYESFGFISEGESYLEDGIPHIQMRRRHEN